VLDLGMVWAGPYCGRLLAGLGADVVKVEGPRRRDGTRPPDDWSGCSGFFADLNRNKKSLVLDLSAEAGRTTFGELIRVIDIMVENFSPRVMPNFGLDYSALSKLNSKIVQVSMPAFESDGERAQFVSYGSGLELFSGLGIPGQDGQLEPAPVPYLDLLTGVYGAIAAVTALLRRDQVGVGSWVEVAQCLVARDLRQWCPDDLWSVRRPYVDPGAVVWSSGLLAGGFYSHARGDGYCHHLSRCPWIIAGFESREPWAPRYGADSSPVLEELGGVTKNDIDRLIGQGVVVDSSRMLTGVA